MKKANESLAAYKVRVIDPISDTYCGAKWYNATIWLGHGQTTSCHHPPAHRIPLEEIKDNPSAIHNRHRWHQNEFVPRPVPPLIPVAGSLFGPF